MLNCTLKNRQKIIEMCARAWITAQKTRTFTTTESRTIARNDWVLALINVSRSSSKSNLLWLVTIQR